MDERAVAVAEAFCRRSGVNGELYGGFNGAARKMAGFFPPWQEPELSAYPIKAVELTLPKGARLTHRDFLGSLMSLRLTRESIGDIVQGEGKCHIFAQATVAPGSMNELVKVGGYGVKCGECAGEVAPAKPAFEERRGTVASARLDNIIKLLTGLSREKGAALIASDQVMLNHIVCPEVDTRVREGDILSIRGHGRFRVEETGPVTKKGRLTIVCAKYT
ncbi:MAG: RNA-binding protein [Oscillospiraceae bacterium]|nr:RNA-binding protein [Oscillospiraceae bacterium]